MVLLTNHKDNAFPKYIDTIHQEFLLKLYSEFDLSERKGKKRLMVQVCEIQVCESKDNKIIQFGNNINEQYSKL